MTSRTLDAYLTARARRTWPRAQVWRSEVDRYDLGDCVGKVARTFTLRRRLHDWVTLGDSFGAAKAALDALAASETQAEVTP